MDPSHLQWCHAKRTQLEHKHLLKEEIPLTSPQGIEITLKGGKQVLNFCANNYLGLSNDPKIIHSACQSLREYGLGMSSVRFICGTHQLHHSLEKKISAFLGTEDSLLFTSCFDANAGLFEAILNEQDAVLSDQLNHASIIDGIRLCKAHRYPYQHMDMTDLEDKLKTSQAQRFRLITTDGVFSMDGHCAPLDQICALANQYKSLVMVDDSHAVGFWGPNGKGSGDYWHIQSDIDIFTGTFGKALGGAMGGYISGRKEIIEWCREVARPYLFSNSLPPMVVQATIDILNRIESDPRPRDKLFENTQYMRQALSQQGFKIPPGTHPIIPIMIGDSEQCQTFSHQLVKHGILAVAFHYPVVPKHLARIRIQMSALHSLSHMDHAIEVLAQIGRQLKIIR